MTLRESGRLLRENSSESYDDFVVLNKPESEMPSCVVVLCIIITTIIIHQQNVHSSCVVRSSTNARVVNYWAGPAGW
jgi:hypothetical protein